MAKRTWTKVKPGVYTSDDYVIERKYDRAAGGTQWRLTSRKNALARSRWFNTLGDAKDFVEDEAQEASQPPARYICKNCGAESPPGIGYVLGPGEEPDRSEPDPNCPHPHLHRVEYCVKITTWDDWGKGHTEALADGPVKDHLLEAAKVLGLFPDLETVAFRSKDHRSEIRIYRKENNQ